MKICYLILKLTFTHFQTNHLQIYPSKKYSKNDIKNFIIENSKHTKYVSPSI